MWNNMHKHSVDIVWMMNSSELLLQTRLFVAFYSLNRQIQLQLKVSWNKNDKLKKVRDIIAVTLCMSTKENENEIAIGLKLSPFAFVKNKSFMFVFLHD